MHFEVNYSDCRNQKENKIDNKFFRKTCQDKGHFVKIRELDVCSRKFLKSCQDKGHSVKIRGVTIRGMALYNVGCPIWYSLYPLGGNVMLHYLGGSFVATNWIIEFCDNLSQQTLTIRFLDDEKSRPFLPRPENSERLIFSIRSVNALEILPLNFFGTFSGTSLKILIFINSISVLARYDKNFIIKSIIEFFFNFSLFKNFLHDLQLPWRHIP